MCVIIIGAGPAGCEAAYRLAQAGETVELIEKESETGGGRAPGCDREPGEYDEPGTNCGTKGERRTDGICEAAGAAGFDGS